MEFTLVYHLYIAFWGVICYLPIPPTNREPETTIVTGLFFGGPRNIRSPAMLVCGFPRCDA